MAEVERITPYGEEDGRHKGEQVRDMFDSIAPAYDIMNRMMTLGVDKRWRKRCVKIVKESGAKTVLDVAAGTGDLTVALGRALPSGSIVGADLSEGMIEVGRRKIKEKGLENSVSLVVADALCLPFENDTFDALTIAFGVRNFENLSAGYTEMARVLKPGGTLVVLELTQPSSKIVKPFYRFYTRCVIPGVGRLVSKDRRAYSYLPESIAAVPTRNEMTALISECGFENAQWKSLTFGVAAIYIAKKRI